MREYSTPQTIEIPTTGNLTDDVVRNAAEAPEVVQFSRATADGGWADVTCAAFLDEVTAVAKGLIASGIERGDRVAVISRTRYEWTLLDYAIWFAGAATVPIYESSSEEQIQWILSDSGARAVVCEDATHLARVDALRAGLTDLEHVWTIDDGAVAALTTAGAGVADADLEERRTSVGPADLATLIYTSGTTGRPKGCMLTHDNFQTELCVAVAELERLFDTEGASTLLFLPLAHVFARIIQVGCVKSRTRLGHSADIKNLLPQLATFRPTFILAVPRVFEKVFNTASQKATADGKGKIFDRAAETAIAYSRALDGGRMPLRVRTQHALFGRLVYGKLRTALGGNCEFAVSGGAPLGERLGHFYRGIGVTVLEGYGLTETTAALTVNLPDAQKVGTVGRPLPGTAVRIADDGELLFRGGQVFTGYWNNPAATAEALDEGGWFHTGDVGEVDDEGFVRITGRKKEILVTAGGKNVAPAVLEDRVRASALVSQCLVVGDGQPFIGALVTIDEEAFPAWAEHHGKTGKIADLVDDDDLRAEIQAAVDEANKAVSKAESIRKFTILPADWTEEAGQVTPSLKLKRNVVMRECRDEIAALYS
ncbi:AMP-binding protein [Pimelobacter simplex]|uniref:Acyl-CoA synthetase n=1 Tax=Nocardioides simplex TaxID=2045 RepID=A0A0A1DKR6_NOCSI|nr:AMP-dependent synthetase/ligase [Pimelobacter simplex]AIY17158.1 Long-chain fatty-acid-CoA ligase, Mycobacterial subgroup FadD15 [Pimelobacter simplex]MCG8151669.1 AMP-binding protein [Pimelobacter simplex]GEB13152.1 long-chain-fatty-acid--CoA ligase [Pimelobacter simplex]SFM48750.1 long-chain acyl-CoA synthetase [Pimelobacter simplex]